MIDFIMLNSPPSPDRTPRRRTVAVRAAARKSGAHALCAREAILRIMAPITHKLHNSGGSAVKMLLALSRAIDALNNFVGRAAYWLILAAVLISAGNAVIRYSLNMSSNAWLEIQWYLFSAVFLFCAGYTLLHNQHIRIDVVTGRFSARVHAWIDI